MMLKISFYIISIILLLGFILKLTGTPDVDNNSRLSPRAQQKILQETQHIAANSLQQNDIKKTYTDWLCSEG